VSASGRTGAACFQWPPCNSQQMALPVVLEPENALRSGPGAMSLEAVVVFDDGVLEIDFARRDVLLDGKRFILTPKELGLVRALVHDYGKPFPEESLIELMPARCRVPRVRWLRVVHVHRPVNRLVPPVPATTAIAAAKPTSTLASRSCSRSTHPVEVRAPRNWSLPRDDQGES
jgi:hypothetical protein